MERCKNGEIHVAGWQWWDREHVLHRFEVGDWVWCLHCERCYQVGEFRLEVGEEDGFGYQMCPYEGCDGATVGDGWAWEYVRECDHADYPELPERGEVYPLYG